MMPNLEKCNQHATLLYEGYKATGFLWGFRMGMMELIQWQVAQLLNHYLPAEFPLEDATLGVSLSAFDRLTLLIPNLEAFKLSFRPSEYSLWLAFQTFDLERYKNSNLSLIMAEDLPRPADMHKVYWMFSNHLAQLGYR